MKFQLAINLERMDASTDMEVAHDQYALAFHSHLPIDSIQCMSNGKGTHHTASEHMRPGKVIKHKLLSILH